MSEVLRELVVALSLDSDHFARNLRTLGKQIKEAESTFNLAGAGVDKFEKTIQGAESKLSMLGSKLTRQNRAVEQYSRALVAANQKLTDSYARQERMKAALEDARTEYQRIGQQVTAASTKHKEYARTIGALAGMSLHLRCRSFVGRFRVGGGFDFVEQQTQLLAHLGGNGILFAAGAILLLLQVQEHVGQVFDSTIFLRDLFFFLQ